MVPMEALVRLAVLSLPAVLLAGCGGPEDETATATAAPTTTADLRDGRIVVQDTFSDPTSGWDSRVFEDGELGYTDGTYRIFVKDERSFFVSEAELAGSFDALRLEVEATQLAGTSGDVVGARCYTDFSSDIGYIVGIAPAQRGYIVAAFRGDDYTLLESSGEATDAVRPLREENQLRVECVASPDGPTVLTLAVNGQTLVRAEDETGGREFDGVGLFVDTAEGAAEALFDDLVVTELVPR
jgi:hypothetical protein